MDEIANILTPYFKAWLDADRYVVVRAMDESQVRAVAARHGYDLHKVEPLDSESTVKRKYAIR